MIANELNARVECGEPGIPVYQGHPDVPHLAAKYPDKGALGWVVKMELANENGKEATFSICSESESHFAKWGGDESLKCRGKDGKILEIVGIRCGEVSQCGCGYRRISRL